MQTVEIHDVLLKTTSLGIQVARAGPLRSTNSTPRESISSGSGRDSEKGAVTDEQYMHESPQGKSNIEYSTSFDLSSFGFCVSSSFAMHNILFSYQIIVPKS